MYSKEDLVNGFLNIGIQEGDTLLLHSSYKSLGEIEGGAKTFFNALISVLKDSGTLLVPAFTYSTVNEQNPYFNYNETPSVTGYLSEYFRTQVKGVKRSKHLTHSFCALGRHTEFLLKNHEKDTTMVGENSPIRKLPLLNGKILFVGCGTAHNTTIHGIEETVLPPYIFHNATFGEYIFDDGNTKTTKKLKRFTFGTTSTKQRYLRFIDLLADNEYKTDYICDAPSYLMSARMVWDKGTSKMKEDPFYFVDSPLQKCPIERLDIRNFKKDNLKVEIYNERNIMGKKAAKDIAERFDILIKAKGEINVVWAAAPSQNDVLQALVEDKSIKWEKINAFHMDEYIGLDKNAPQRFGNFLKEHIFGLVPFKSVNYIDPTATNAEKEAERYANLLNKNKIDVVVLGIGENGHIAFNEPSVADFNDKKAVKPVRLEEKCRQQQVNDACFDKIDDVPTHAITLTVPTLFNADYLYCIVPAITKAKAVYETIFGKIDEHCPATILRKHKNAILYLDRHSANCL